MERVFYSVLERVGTEGRYQVISQMIHCLYLLIAGASTFFNAFLFVRSICFLGITNIAKLGTCWYRISKSIYQYLSKANSIRNLLRYIDIYRNQNQFDN